MTYCFKCRVCGRTATHSKTNWSVACPCGREMSRDYRAEGVGATGLVQLKRERDIGGREAYRDQFLPTAKDYAGPGDPDGEKGIRQWNDEHQPHSSASGAPLRPESKRRSW